LRDRVVRSGSSGSQFQTIEVGGSHSSGTPFELQSLLVPRAMSQLSATPFPLQSLVKRTSQSPPAQISVPLHESASRQSASTAHVWHTSCSSLQNRAGHGGLPSTQTPVEQVSVPVQNSPSLHSAAVQHSDAHVSVASQHTGVGAEQRAPLPTQLPPEQVSPVVQALPSSQWALLFVWTQPHSGIQESSVQTLPSLQLRGLPATHVPPEQTSLTVQALPSLQGAVLLVKTHPVAGAQVSSVHGLLSLHTSAAPPTQTPAEQVSLVVQALPSLQGAVLLVKTHPVAGAQVSSVHGLLSLHTSAAPPTHTPAEQVSFVVQALPSLHGAVLLVKTHPVAGAQESSVQTLLSLQVIPVPAHTPAVHTSPLVQALPSSHTVPSATLV